MSVFMIIGFRVWDEALEPAVRDDVAVSPQMRAEWKCACWQ